MKTISFCNSWLQVSTVSSQLLTFWKTKRRFIIIICYSHKVSCETKFTYKTSHYCYSGLIKCQSSGYVRLQSTALDVVSRPLDQRNKCTDELWLITMLIWHQSFLHFKMNCSCWDIIWRYYNYFKWPEVVSIECLYIQSTWALK